MRGQVVDARRAAPDTVWGPSLGPVRRRWAPFEAVAENDVNLAASRHKPRVREAVAEEDPAELIREVRAIKCEIGGRLAPDLKDVESVS